MPIRARCHPSVTGSGCHPATSSCRPRQGTHIAFRLTHCLSVLFAFVTPLSTGTVSEVSYASVVGIFRGSLRRSRFLPRNRVAFYRVRSGYVLLTVVLDAIQPRIHHPWGRPRFQPGEEGEALSLRNTHLFRRSAGLAALAPSDDAIAPVLGACPARYARPLQLPGRYPGSLSGAPTSPPRLRREADALAGFALAGWPRLCSSLHPLAVVLPRITHASLYAPLFGKRDPWSETVGLLVLDGTDYPTASTSHPAGYFRSTGRQ